VKLEANAFRSALREQALAQDWPGWDATRLIFADWLADHGQVEEYAARANWRCTWVKHLEGPEPEPFVFKFVVSGIRNPRPHTKPTNRGFRTSLSSRYNAQPLLGFAPGTLRMLRAYTPGTRFISEHKIAPPFDTPNCSFWYEFSWVTLREVLGEFPHWKKKDTNCIPSGFLWLWTPGREPARRQQLLFEEQVDES
jgi:uncharacterized protein (TIGR02996 family)